MTNRTLADLADESLLRSAWKDIRSALRKIRLQELSLAHDAIEWTGYDFHAGENIRRLSAEIRNYSYRPSSPTVIRSAKSVGLTRPVSYLAIDDAIVYLSLIRLTENALLQQGYPWSYFGRAQRPRRRSRRGPPKSEPPDYSWFVQWLQRQGQVWEIVQSCDWVVETDISNFFGTLDLDSLVSYVRTNGVLDETLSNLLRVKLGEYSPLNDYRPHRRRSLPQETLDVSRILAHVFLHQLDKEFEDEGDATRYSRWVDDVVMGADSWSEALQLVRRFQISLERLDLYPNSAKTRIIPSAQFAIDYDKRENDYLGEIEAQIELLGRPLLPRQFRSRVQTHARMGDSRKKSWDRVLRRYYTISKRLHDDSLLRWWHRHIPEVPLSTAHILEYVSTFRITKRRLSEYRSLLSELGGAYTDIEILVREAILLSPNVADLSLWDELAKWGVETVNESRLIAPNIAASAALLVAKFGSVAQLQSLRPAFEELVPVDNAARAQLMTILYGREIIGPDDLSNLLHVAGRDSSQKLRFVRLVSEGDTSAVSRLRWDTEPVMRTHPSRRVIKPRLLALLPLLRKVDPSWSTVARSWERKLQKSDSGFRDHAALRIVRGKENR